MIKTFPDGRMTPKGASEWSGYAEKTLAIMRSKGTGPRFIKRNGRIFYPLEDLKAWMNEGGTVVSTAQARLNEAQRRHV